MCSEGCCQGRESDYWGTESFFSDDLSLPLYCVWRMLADRLSSPMTSIWWVGVPGGAWLDLVAHREGREDKVESKKFT